MSDDRWDRIEALFEQALDLDEASMPRWLDGLDADVRPDIERLLRAHRASSGFLEAPAAAVAAELVNEEGASAATGADLGPYRIVREIGRGGMGAVFLAHRDDVDLDVAIKRLSQSVTSSRAVRAFLAERRTLARLDHPNIARLLDAGLSGGGEPYFVMEWIDGESLTAFCDAHEMGVRERLALFLDVCHAVEYAHGRLVVHRDLKPSNVLVTRDGVPKLLDFGIAKVLDDSELRSATHTVGQFMTPQYASPEQIRGEPVGTSTDVYSLGALLYELLAGRPPHDVETGTPFEVSRVVLETEPPPLSEAIPADRAPEVAACRSETPRRLRQRLAGDLEMIVAQAMHKDHRRRYASVAALAEDIQRHQGGGAVLARGDSFGYRAERFARRNWLPLTLATMALIIAGAFAGYHTRRVAVERDRAQREAETAESVSRFLISVFLASDPDQFGGTEPTAQDLLVRGAERAREEIEGDPAVRARLLDVLGEVQRKRGRYEDAKPLLEEALTLRRDVYADGHADVIQSLTHLSGLRANVSDWSGAVDLAQEAYDLSARLYGPDHPETVYKLHNLGIFTMMNGDLEGAESILRQSLDERRRLLGDDHTGVPHAIGALGNLMRDLGRYQEAAELYSESLELSRAIYGDEHRRVASVWNDLGRMHVRLYHFDEAERCLTEALRIRQQVYGPESIKTVNTIATLGAVHFDRGAFDAAASDYLTALEITRNEYGPEHRLNIALLTGLARAQDGMGRASEAEATFVEALAVAEATRGVGHKDWASAAERFGRFLCSQDRVREGLPWLVRALDVYLETYGDDHRRTRAARITLADAHRRLGYVSESRRLLGEVTFAGAARNPGEASERANWALVAARADRDEGNLEAARAGYEEALDKLTSFLPPDHWRIVDARAELEEIDVR